MQLNFESPDKLLELKMAIWETQLQDLYPTAHITCAYDHVHNHGHVTIEFTSGEDHVHWCLSQPACSQLNHLLTYHMPLLNCTHEQQIRSIH